MPSTGAPASRVPANGQRRGQSPGQPGRRPTSPAFLFAVACLWIICGSVVLLRLHASWKFVPGLVFLGVGVLFLRGAAATVVRRDQRRR